MPQHEHAIVGHTYLAGAMTGKLTVDPASALAAHRNALMGTFLLVAVGWTMPMLRYRTQAKHRLAWLFVVPSFSNWGLTAIKAALAVTAIEPNGGRAT